MTELPGQGLRRVPCWGGRGRSPLGLQLGGDHRPAGTLLTMGRSEWVAHSFQSQCLSVGEKYPTIPCSLPLHSEAILLPSNGAELPANGQLRGLQAVGPWPTALKAILLCSLCCDPHGPRLESQGPVRV